MSRTTVALVALAAAAAARPGPAAAQPSSRIPLKTSQGTVLLAGGAGFTITHIAVERIRGQTGFTFSGKTRVSYFAADNVAFGGEALFAASFGDFTATPKVLGLGLNLAYLFNGGGFVVPYAGASVGPYFAFETARGTQTGLRAGLPVGLYIAVGRHVAVDLGVALEIRAFFESPTAVSVIAPIGFLGLAGFI